MMEEIPEELLVLSLATCLIGIYLAWLCRSEWQQSGRFSWWRAVEDGISQILMMAMLATATLQVVARYALSEEISVPWTDEFSRLVLIWAALWGAVAVQRLDDHITMSLVYDLLPPAVQRALRVVGDLVVVAVLLPVVWLGWRNAESVQIMTTISLGLPLSVFAYSIPVCGALMVGHSAWNLVRRLRGVSVGAPAGQAA
jgi:TRAP-type C4-dicarboxylate transport system permease small subunit